nr:immunoglobulin light chain junction region [Macaca mulatta]
CLQIKNSPYSF